MNANPQSAQASLLISISSVDISTQPDMEDPRSAVALRSIRRAIDSPNELINVSSMMERFPRIGFVISILIGFATSRCAAMLGIEDTAVRALVGAAILQIQAVMVRTAKESGGPVTK